jgi:receptor tyrosine kinase-like orphan receptor 1
MVFEHMAHGDLHEFLIFHSPKSDLNESEDSGEGRVLTQSEMSYIAIQIAAGEDVKICHLIFICHDLRQRILTVLIYVYTTHL